MADFHKLDERLSAMSPWVGPLFDTVDEVLSFMQSKTPSPASPSSSGFMPKTSAELHAEKVACLLNWRCSYAAWDGDEYGDEVLIALLSSHFGGDLEAMLSLIHARANETKLKAMRKLARSCQGATSTNDVAVDLQAEQQDDAACLSPRICRMPATTFPWLPTRSPAAR
jgi:hypothetical protein